MSRLPSIRTLESAFPGHGRALRRLLEDDRAVRQHPAAIARRAECLHSPTLLDLRLHALNAEAETCGVEYIAHKNDGYRIGEQYGLEYLNTGDTYATTIIYDHSRGSWRVGCWGDVVEARPNLYP
jgi:hypothetical protein